MHLVTRFALLIGVLICSSEAWAPPARPRPPPPPRHDWHPPPPPPGGNQNSGYENLPFKILPGDKIISGSGAILTAAEVRRLVEGYTKNNEPLFGSVEPGQTFKLDETSVPKGPWTEELQRQFDAYLSANSLLGLYSRKHVPAAVVEVARPMTDEPNEGQAQRYAKLNVTVASDGKTSAQSVNVPAWEFFNVEKALIRKRIAKSFSGIPDDSPILFPSLPAGLSSAELLPGRITARTFSKSARFAADHVQNLENLRRVKLDPANAKFFNFVGPPSDGGAAARWHRFRKIYDETAAALRLPFGSGKDELLSTLEDGKTDVVVVVAHGDSRSVYMPDGSKLTTDDVLNLGPIASSGGRPPIVILLSCETGSSLESGLTTIAEALMLRGRASAVLAPTQAVSAGRPTARLLREVVKSAEAGDLSGFIRGLRGPWQVIVENSNGGATAPDG
jgi:hypothetical protein